VNEYEITHMIIDDDFAGEEYVTTDITYNNKAYSITYKKADLEVINIWVFEGEQSLPAHLSDTIIEAIREEVKNRI
jgi:hypothetical protein